VTGSAYERDAAAFIAGVRTPRHDAYWSYPDGTSRVADAAALPFGDGKLDLVVAYNSPMDVADMPGSVPEAARVSDPAASPTRRSGSRAYLARGRRRSLALERDGLCVTFEDNLYPLEAAGLLAERVREPTFTGDDERKRRIPQFLWLRAVKP
jgi:hypothetical protein